MSKRILIIGNSVAVRVRPRDEQHGNYGEQLTSRFGHSVENRSKPASMVTDLDMQAVLTAAAASDAVVVHFGIVEACTRSVSRRTYQYINRPGSEQAFLERLPVLAVIKFESMFRRKLVNLRGNRPWLALNDFGNHFGAVIAGVAETGARVVCIGINNPSQRIERELPGTEQNIPAYNEVIRSACARHDVGFIDTYNRIRPQEMPDGIHYNADGHRIVADEINLRLT